MHEKRAFVIRYIIEVPHLNCHSIKSRSPYLDIPIADLADDEGALAERGGVWPGSSHRSLGDGELRPLGGGRAQDGRHAGRQAGPRHRCDADAGSGGQLQSRRSHRLMGGGGSRGQQAAMSDAKTVETGKLESVKHGDSDRKGLH